MKLIQLFESQFPTSREEVEAICKKYKIQNYTINDDLSIDVDGDVDLHYRFLDFLPIKFGTVSGDFGCSGNQLTSLKGAPREVGGSFDCGDNKLISLKGAPREIGGSFSCSVNMLSSLEGSPKLVGGDFYCEYNHLTSLEGAPREVGKDFYCNDNPYLKSLEGIGNVRGSIISDLE